ncbi:MAG TPA: DUF1778 domain-containing protein [Armatimonadota bacterium]|nr:DUF1778 domain-containing protein [Armatimonadota bacterium]
MAPETRTEQVSLRLLPQVKDILKQGASAAGQTLTDFMVTSSIARARELLRDERIISMSQAAFDAFSASLADPETRRAGPRAAHAIKEYAASLREDGTFG